MSGNATEVAEASRDERRADSRLIDQFLSIGPKRQRTQRTRQRDVDVKFFRSGQRPCGSVTFAKETTELSAVQ
ncbi:hypothetical protein ABBQ38_000316 [Trebouxia sp. C0009 RCD-2024]